MGRHGGVFNKLNVIRVGLQTENKPNPQFVAIVVRVMGAAIIVNPAGDREKFVCGEAYQ